MAALDCCRSGVTHAKRGIYKSAPGVPEKLFQPSHRALASDTEITGNPKHASYESYR